MSRGLIVQEWIERTGGAERVLNEMVRTFPDSDLWCLWNDAPDRFPDHTVTESWLSRPPWRGRKAATLALMPPTWRRVTAPGVYDWVLVSSYVFAHHARLPASPDAHSFVYVHTPARYVWAPDRDPRGAHPLVRAAAGPLRAVDRARARGAGRSFAANSHFIRERVRRAWDVDARVIHPPVDTTLLQSVSDWSDHLDDGERHLLASIPGPYILGASRFVAYKRLDAVIAAGDAATSPW